MSEENKGIATTLPKGTVVQLNGLTVEFTEKLHFHIVNAATIDQAAEMACVHNLPCDFSHVDPESGKQVTYSAADAQRIETDVEFVEAPKGKKK